MDQLVAGPAPDNFPSVAMLDWTTGQPNAKYWAVQMLAALGTGRKDFMPTSFGGGNATLLAAGMEIEGRRKLLLVSKTGQPQTLEVEGCTPGTTVVALDGTLDGVRLEAEPGFVPPVTRSCGAGGALPLGPYGVALVELS